MRVFNAATDVIKQGGRRRGANMGILNVWHPDILAFIAAKKKEGEIANFNISVMVNDRFMDLVAGKQFDTVWLTREGSGEKITVGQIWTGIVEGIWKNGEPGILFYDEINRHNPTPLIGDIDTTNPCGEQPLLPYESCVLGSINLAACVHDRLLDGNLLGETARMATRFLDTVIDKNVFPIPQIGEATRKTRKIGLGVMGVHDAMLMIGLAYDSTEGRAWCEQVMKLVTDTAVDESHRLAEAKGPFPAWKGNTWKDFTVRNAAMTTVAPTGTIWLLAGCSSGIEPVFSFAYTRKNTVGKTFVIVNPVFREALVRTVSDMGFAGEEREKKAEEVIAHVHETGTIQDLHWLPEGFLALFKTALDIPWRDHILMQASFQKHVHASISKTINMPCSATKEDCEEALLMAWKLGLKGITIYRTGSRDDVVLALKEKSPAAPTVQGPGEPATAAAAMRAVPEKIPSLSIDPPKDWPQDVPLPVRVLPSLRDGKPAGGKTHGGLYPDGRERGVRREQQCAWPCDQHGPPEWRALREICQTVRKSELHLRDQEPLLGRPLLCGRGRAVHRVSAKNQSVATLSDWNIRKTGEQRLCPECHNPLDFGEGCNQGICKHCGWTGCS